jgi:DNA-binding Lrp family transcriptional regulator
MDLDDIDRRLLALLRDDARRPASGLAAALGVSRGTINNRIAKLQRAGAIRGFTVRLGAQGDGAGGVRAITSIEIHGRAAGVVLRMLKGLPEIRALHTTNGRWDIVGELEAENLQALDSVLSRIRLLDGVASTETSILLTTSKG